MIHRQNLEGMNHFVVTIIIIPQKYMHLCLAHFIVTLIILPTLTAQYVDLDCLRIAHFQLATGTTVSGPGSAQTFPFSWPTSIPGIQKSSMGLGGFRIEQVNGYLSYEGAMTTVNDAGGNIIINPNQVRSSDIVIINMEVFATSQQCSNGVDIYSQVLNPRFLNLNSRSASTSSESFTITGGAFNLSNVDDYYVLSYFYDFSCVVPIGQLQQLKLTSRTVNSNGELVIRLESSATYDNTFTSIRISVLIIKNTAFDNLYLYYKLIRNAISGCTGSSGCNNSTSRPPTTQSLVALYDFATSSIDTNFKGVVANWQTSNIQFEADKIVYTTYEIVNYLLCDTGYYSAGTGLQDCLACNSPCLNCTTSATKCTACYSQFYLSTNQECIRCDTSCLSCIDSSSNCLSCDSDYFLHESTCIVCPSSWPSFSLDNYTNQTSCGCSNCSDACSSAMLYCTSCYTNSSICANCLAGSRVDGGCSLIDGCNRVQQTNQGTSSHSAICLQCDASYDLVDGDCVCKDGTYQTNGQCTSTYGCLAVADVNGTSVCKSCNTSLGLVTTDNGCACSNGYSLSSGACVPTCGDGMVYQQDCDDSNTDDGDGCDSACVVENKYRCENGSASSASECTFFGDVILNISWMENTGSVNEGVITVTAEPALSSIAKMDMTQLADFKVNNVTVSIKSWTYLTGQIQLFFDYDWTLQQKDGTLSIALDQKYVKTMTVALQTQEFSFLVDSRNEELNYYSLVEEKNSLMSIITIYCACLVLVFMVGTCIHSMVGVEVLFLNQVIFLLHFQVKDYSHSWGSLQALTYCMGNVFYSQNGYNNFILGRSMEQMQFGLTNYRLTIASACLLVIGVATITLVVNLLAGKFFISGLRTERPAEQANFLSGLRNFTFRFLRSIAMNFMMISFLFQFTYSQSQTLFWVFAKVTLAVSVNVICHTTFFTACQSQTRLCDVVKAQPRMHYLQVYLAYIIVSSFVFGATVSEGSSSIQTFLLFTISFGFLIYLCFHDPYFYLFHRLCVYFPTFTILSFSLLVILKNQASSINSQQNDLLTSNFVIVVLCSNLFLNSVRIGHVIYLKTCKKQKQLLTLHQQCISECLPKVNWRELKKRKVSKPEEQQFTTSKPWSNIYTLETQVQIEQFNRPSVPVLSQAWGKSRHPIEAMSFKNLQEEYIDIGNCQSTRLRAAKQSLLSVLKANMTIMV